VKFKFVHASRALAASCANARSHHAFQLCTVLLVLGVLALPQEAYADGCTPVTSSGSPVTNTTVTCTGTTLNQNTFFSFGVGYGTFSETGNTIDVQSAASVTGDSFGFGLSDGNTVNNSGTVPGAADGIDTTSGSNVSVNNLTATSTISGTSGLGITANNVVLSNAGTVTGASDGILAEGTVTLTANSGSITGTGSGGLGIRAVSVLGSNAGTISGTSAIIASDVNLTSNSGTIQGNIQDAINSSASVFIGTNSGSIVGVSDGIFAVGNATVTNTNTGNITGTGSSGLGIFAGGDISVTNSGNISGDQRAILAQGSSLDLTNNFGGSITSGDGDGVASVGTATIVNDGTISGGSNGVNSNTANIRNGATGVIETRGVFASAIGTTSLLLNNAGIVRDTAAIFGAISTTTLQAGSTNSGTITGSIAAFATDDFDLANSGTIIGGVIGISANNGLTFANSGTVAADRRGIQATDAIIMNADTITATGVSGLQVIAISSNTANTTNTVSGTISTTGTASNNDAINTFDTTTVDNSGVISSTGRSAVRVGSNASITNEAGGTITGMTAIVFRDAGVGLGAPVNGSVFNAGTITGTGGTAINFAFTAGAGPMTLTLGPGSVINGTVLGTGADTLQLGGKGTDTFNVDNIGATQQYQGFVAFNKTGGSTWTLTGSGTQNWSVLSGTLIGDTNTFNADIINDGTIEFDQDFDGIYQNIISGSGSLIKDGTGVLELAGANTYSGGTTISGGTLVLGTRGFSLGSIVGDAVDNGALVVNRPDSFTLSGVITGSGTFVQAGPGTTILTGANTYSGGTFVNNGILQLGDAGDATAVVGPISVSNGASLDVFNADFSQVTTLALINGVARFELSSSAATAEITVTNSGVLEFTDMASADHAHIGIAALGTVEFASFSTAANAQIDASAGGNIVFLDNSSAGQAQITLGGSAVLSFSNSSSGGSASITTAFGTHVFISGLTNGGTTIASLNGAGNVVLGANSLTIGGDNSDSAISGAISGSGGLVKAGSGSLTLTGSNTFTGLTTISGGTLQLGNGGSTGAFAGDVVDNATLVFDLSGFVTIPGAISGTGSLVQSGTGTVILVSTNTYTGGTTISSGTLQIGNGGTTGSIVGDIVDNATLAFDRSDNATFAGAISGTGALTQLGGGMLALTGTNTYAGGTTISAGTLQLGNGSTTGSIVGDVADNGVLVFDRSDRFVFSGVISGIGSITQAGPGVVILTGDNSYTGGTTISGTLQIGDGGTTGSIVGDVVDDGSLVFKRSDDVVFPGSISGTGGLIKLGDGTLTLTGPNNYSGGTTIVSGMLQIGNGGTEGSIIGDVVDEGTLNFVRSDTVTFSGTISGFGGVVQNGSGVTILTGTSSYTGSTTVNAGILDVNGSIATSAVTVNGATLKGNGTVGPLTLATGATVAPGNSIGTLHVAGNVTFAGGSSYSVELNPAGQSDLIAATDAATIAPGALVQITAAAGTYAAQTHYVILTAAGGVTGTFATPTINLPILAAQLIYQPNEVDLLLTLKDINLIPPAHTPNQIATAVAVKAGGPQSVIFGQFLQDSENGLGFVTDALDQLSGEIHPSLVTEEMEDSRLVQLSIMQRLRQTATGDVSGTLAPAPEAREIVDGISIWTHAFADWGTFENDGNVATLDQNLSGILAGIDARIGAADIGLGGGYSHSHANQRTSIATGGNGYVAAYGGWADGAVALRAGATYGWGNRNILRTVTFPGFAETLTSKEDQHGSQVFGEVAYALNTERLALEPFAGIAWDDASTGAFAEQGGAAAVSGTGGDTSVAFSSLGVRLAARPVGVDALTVTPRASIAWQHAFGGLRPGQVLTFEDTGQSFLALGSVIDSDSADIALGFDAQIGSGGTLSFGYEGILSSRVRLNTIHAGLNWNF
jgi:outer membrane autotransporter protein